MKFAQAFLAALVGGVAGFFVVLAITTLAARALHVSNREGAVGYLGVASGILGGIAGLALGLWLALRGSGLGAGRGLFTSVGVVLALLAVAGLIVLRIYLSRPHPLEIGGARANLEFELRVPLSRSLSKDTETPLKVTLSTARSQIDASLPADRVRHEDGYLVLGGVVNLAYRERRRLLVVNVPGAPTELFDLAMGAKPEPGKALGPWVKSSFFDRAPAGSPPQPLERGSLPDGFELRYRVALYGE